MSYRVTRDAQDRPILTLTGEPPYCHVDPPEPTTGAWLLLTFASWSMPDIRAVQMALDAAKHFAGMVRLGLRVDDDLTVTPHWRLLSDGQVRMDRTGVMTTEELIESVLQRLGDHRG